MGRHKGTDVYMFSGIIDEVRVYERALNAQEVLELFEGEGQPIHRADSNPQDGCVDMGELTAFIELWLTGSDVSMPEVMGAVGLWRAGTGC